MFLKMMTKQSTNNSYRSLPNGYQTTIQNGLRGVRNFSGQMYKGIKLDQETIEQLANAIKTADAIVIGAGAGLSTAAGFTYGGKRFRQYFFDFAATYGIQDMYSGGFYPFPKTEIYWAWWARHIYFNRYVNPPKSVYQKLLGLIQEKEYFVITTNVDHMFQKSGFDKKRIFYTQGDYGLFQSVNQKNQKTYDNEEWVMQAMVAQGFVRDEHGIFQVPNNHNIRMEIPTALIPKCIDDVSDMEMNLRADQNFVEDEGWHKASAAYAAFLEKYKNKHVLYLELGVGGNTPIIIKYPFWQMVYENSNAVYACLNYQESYCPKEIVERSICIDGDIFEVLQELESKGV